MSFLTSQVQSKVLIRWSIRYTFLHKYAQLVRTNILIHKTTTLRVKFTFITTLAYIINRVPWKWQLRHASIYSIILLNKALRCLKICNKEGESMKNRNVNEQLLFFREVITPSKNNLFIKVRKSSQDCLNENQGISNRTLEKIEISVLVYELCLLTIIWTISWSSIGIWK